jgi:ribosomal-protein-alanine N-acetyltransferase
MKNYSKILASLTELPTPRITLKPVQIEWAESLFEAVYESRIELREYMAWETDEPEAIRAFLEGSVKEMDAGKSLAFCIFENETGDILGVIGTKDIDPFTPKVEVGYWIRSNKAGKGYATEALETLVEYCRDVLELVRLDAIVATTNVASQRVMTKCGFQEEGFKAKGLLCHGTWLNLKLYGRVLR